MIEMASQVDKHGQIQNLFVNKLNKFSLYGLIAIKYCETLILLKLEFSFLL